jgi:hypothetical protein
VPDISLTDSTATIVICTFDGSERAFPDDSELGSYTAYILILPWTDEGSVLNPVEERAD